MKATTLSLIVNETMTKLKNKFEGIEHYSYSKTKERIHRTSHDY